MSNRDNQAWLKSWRDQRTGFHQLVVNRLLKRYWTGATQGQRSRVFVPLCGKSLDMLWLLEQGHEVIGVELSPIAVKAFFAENGLRPTKRRSGAFTRWRSGRIEILCGDYFSLCAADLGHIDRVYDRAALTALPEPLRRRYVERMHALVPATADIFLLTAEDEEPGDEGAADGRLDSEVVSLYAQAFVIELVRVEKGLEVDADSASGAMVRVLLKLYRLTARVAP
jgi:thiopurine S-methyltransferase